MSSGPYTTVAAVPSNGDAIATLQPYIAERKLTGLTVNGPRGASIVIYVGFVAPNNRIDQNPNGFSNTADYPNPRSIPPNTPVIAVWPKQAANANQCSATFVTEG